MEARDLSMNLAEIRKKARQEKARELPDSKTASSSAPVADHAAGVAEQGSIAVCKEEPFPATTPEERAEPVLAEESAGRIARGFRSCR